MHTHSMIWFWIQKGNFLFNWKLVKKDFDLPKYYPRQIGENQGFSMGWKLALTAAKTSQKHATKIQKRKCQPIAKQFLRLILRGHFGLEIVRIGKIWEFFLFVLAFQRHKLHLNLVSNEKVITKILKHTRRVLPRHSNLGLKCRRHSKPGASFWLI